MKYVYRALAIAFFLIAIPRALWMMADDAQHPERWGSINHNFPLEALLLVASVAGVGVLWWQVRRGKQQQLASRNGATHA